MDHQEIVKVGPSARGYDPATEEGVLLWATAVWTARYTGRVIFGQLWYPDPTLQQFFEAFNHVVDKATADFVCPLIVKEVVGG
jgi:hypothetical protein